MKVLLNRRAIPDDPKQNLKACEDFLLLVLHVLVKLAAENVIKESDMSYDMDVTELAMGIVNKFVSIDVNVEDGDDLYIYTRELLTLALVWHSFHDSIKEGDGDCVLLLWKFLLIIFKKSNRKNYSKEAFNLLVQYHFLLSDRLAEQLKWSRFINTHVQIGCNISCDLHIEHLNHQLKDVLRNLRSNLQAGPILRAGRSLGVVHTVVQQFGEELQIASHSNRHSVPAFKKDFDKVYTTLKDADSLLHSSNRKFSHFKCKKQLLNTIDKNGQIINWMVEKIAPMIY